MVLDFSGIGNSYSSASAPTRYGGMVDLPKPAGRRVSPELDGFGIFLETENAIVQNDDGDRDTEPDERLNLRPAMRKTAISDKCADGRVRACQLRSDRLRQSPAKTRKPAGGHAVPP